ncbi:hypothetical protein BC938DRAFT_475101 [Jimgerdemannia flammicorona]|uniref:Uncharacterized protein n=1 Tax=Jimgerdemannia flammicorona TaxID=994334 RepID=A0A433QZF8_9FUNG|nr:hypothetical protein BC938DRAFT_475101 [Jimgerdemannia flammicorona]
MEVDRAPDHLGTTPNPLEPEGLGGSVSQQRRDENVDADDSDISLSEIASKTPNDDIVNTVPGLYRMLSLYKDNGVSGLVDKIILSPDQMEKFCDDITPGSFHSVSKVDYDDLCQRSLHYIGVYGNPVMIAQLLFSINAITAEMLQHLRSESESTYDNSMNVLPSLSPGIYLYHHKPSYCGLVIHWPERGSFAENASADKKKNMINLHRYLCKLTDRQVCLMTEDDVASFIWMDEDNDDCTVLDESGDNDTCFEFEVQSTQEQKEDFTYREGFQARIQLDAIDIRIPKLPNSQESHRSPDVDLSPEIIESIHHQTLATKYYIPASTIYPTVRETLSSTALQKKLRDFLPTCQLNLPESILLKDLRTFVDNAGLPDDISQQCFPNLEVERQMIQQNYVSEEQKAIGNIIKEKEDVDKWVECCLTRYLEETYPNLVKTTHATGPSDEYSLPSAFWNIDGEIRKLVRSVDSEVWKKKKKRFLFSRVLADTILRSESNSSETSTINNLSSLNGTVPYKGEEYIQLVYELFCDKETKLSSLAKKHLSTTNIGLFGRIRQAFTSDEVKALRSQTNNNLTNTTDAEFAEILLFADIDAGITNVAASNTGVTDVITSNAGTDVTTSNAGVTDVATSNADITNIKEKLREDFIIAFDDWRITNARMNVRSNAVLDQLKYAASMKNAELDKKRAAKIDYYKCTSASYRWRSETLIDFEYRLETLRPAKMCVSFYEMQLDRTDFQKLGTDAIDDESYCPSPQWYGYGAHKPPTFEYNPQKYSIR